MKLGILLKQQVINDIKLFHMNFIKSITLIFSFIFITSCGEKMKKEVVTIPPVKETISQQVDSAVKLLDENISSLKTIATLDHHGMAAEVGVYTPPSTVTIFSDPKVDIAIIKENQLVSLDLPFKVLCYTEADTTKVSVAYTSAEFIQKRHQLEDSVLLDYNSHMRKILASFPEEMISKTKVNSVDEGFGIVKIKSDFDYATTVQNLRDIVMSQGDTKWFADIDYQKEAADLDITIRPTILLLFGGPGPGGKAMMTSPKIGLDAFCQKLLVYENSNGEVWVAYNDIVAFAELYYTQSTKPQQMINQRLNMTFSKAVKK